MTDQDTARDCTLIQGDRKVIISERTAYTAYRAMKEKWDNGDYATMFQDDKSITSFCLGELEKAANIKRPPK